MKKIIFSLILWLSLLISSIGIFSEPTFAAAVDLTKDNINNINKLTEHTLQVDVNWWPVSAINNASKSILTTIKTILSGLMVIYVVYAWIQMIMSMWTDEEQLTSSKRQLRYTVVAFVFINIPWALFNAFNSWAITTVNSRTSYGSWFKTPGNEWNIFMDTFSLWRTLNTDIIGFIEIIISAIAIIIIIIAWINMMTSRWREEKVTEAKDKIKWSIIAIILVWFLEAWKYVVFKWKIEDGGNFFESISNLALFFVWPIAIIYLTIAAYTYITANWDEEKLKRAKSIVVNIVLATIILLASYTFLLDLVTL